jgi:diguanylate cyclase (GGDEF)-like protein
MTGHAVDDLLGRPVLGILLAQQTPDLDETVERALSLRGTWRGDLRGKTVTGHDLALRVTISEVRGGARQGVLNHVVTVTDVSQHKADEARIQQLAYFDPLTALPNRRLQNDRLARALVDSAASRQFGAILYLDLDDFKSLNDTRGHDCGDQLLIQVAQRLSACVRQGDSVARMGGDEFVVVLQHLGVHEDAAHQCAHRIAQAMLDALRQPVSLGGDGEHHCTVSIGITLFCGAQLSMEELLQQADLAMYDAKGSGRNQARFFAPHLQASALHRVGLERDLRRALMGEEFVLHYQPQWASDRVLTGAEVLLRWRHPTDGLRSGGDIIAVAERSGLILPLGDWVLQRACETLALWGQTPGREHLTLSVNVSVRQFQQPDFVQLVSDAMARSGCDPRLLCLELTESLFLDVHDQEIEKMRQLKALGVRFSLDDFGTGYSSLAYLKRLPLDTLKIDRCFVNDLDGDPRSTDFVRTIVSLAQALNLDVIAEGVETPEQLRGLQASGCHRFQGYLLGRPVPLEALFGPPDAEFPSPPGP